MGVIHRWFHIRLSERALFREIVSSLIVFIYFYEITFFTEYSHSHLRIFFYESLVGNHLIISRCLCALNRCVYHGVGNVPCKSNYLEYLGIVSKATLQ